MIPKRIIYCWFGGKEKPENVQRCIDTWHKYMPDWEFLEINESNFDINSNEYCKEAYKHKIWGFVADPIRLWALYNYGGIYLDTDIEAHQSFEPLLNNKFFMGFEQPHYFSTATIGAEKGNPIVKEMLDDYDKEKFEVKQNWWEYRTSPMIMTDTLSKYVNRDSMEYQKTDEITIYPKKCFVNHEQLDNEVYCTHHMFGSWIGD